MTKAFKIVHLSDPHLTATDGDARSEPRLFGALKGMNQGFRHVAASARVQACDMLLVTGDITDRGDLESWQNFWETIDQNGLTERTLVIPGNHDVCCLGARLPDWANKGYEKSDMERAQRGIRLGLPTHYTKLPWAHITDDRRIGIFAIDSNNLGNLTAATNAIGEIGHYELVAFANLLAKHKDVPVKFAILHHSPNIPEVATAQKRKQKVFKKAARLTHDIPEDQRRALRLLCITQRVRRILHGHLHMAEDRKVNGVRIIGAPAITEPTDKGYACWEHVVSGSKATVRSRLVTIK